MKKITVWLVNEAENIPGDDNNPRLQRMGLLAYELAKYDVDIIWWHSTFNHNIKRFRSHEDVDEQLLPNMKLNLIHSCGYRKNVCFRRLRHEYITAKKFYKRAGMENRPDIIVVATPTIASTYYATKYAHNNGIPVLVDARDLQPDVYLNPFKGFVRQVVCLGIKPIQHILSKSLKRATGIIGTTEPYLNWALNYAKRERNDNDRVFFVSYPDSGVKTSIDVSSRWLEYKKKDSLVCCFFGQFGKLVNFDVMLDAAERCMKNSISVIFLLCGQGELLEHYKKEKDLRNLDNVFFPGWVNKSDIADIGFISDVGLMAYRKDDNFEMQMPNKFSEYLSLGLAIMLQPTGIMKTVIEDNYCGVQYNNSNELYSALKRLNDDRLLLETMKKNSRSLFEKSFSVEKVYKEYSEYIICMSKEK